MNENDALAGANWSDAMRRIRARTPARLLAGRAGATYRTNTQLELRQAHAAARDAVRAELDLRSVFPPGFTDEWKLFQASTRASNKDAYLLRPDLGRHFDDSSRAEIVRRCAKGIDIQIAIGDGLSVTAVATQIPLLLPCIHRAIAERGWTVGRTFVIRYCRVGILNEIGELLAPKVAILLIGERPGLATAESLSAYMAYRPDRTHTDANRNLISNIHAIGLGPAEAARRILSFVEQMMASRLSGCNLRLDERDPHQGGLPPLL